MVSHIEAKGGRLHANGRRTWTRRTGTQTDRDHAALTVAIKQGRVEAVRKMELGSAENERRACTVRGTERPRGHADPYPSAASRDASVLVAILLHQ